MQGINFRWQHYKRNRLMGMNRYRAAITAGYSETTARAHVIRLEIRLMSDKGGIWQAFDEVGLTDEVMAKSLVEMCQATKVIHCTKIVQEDDQGKIKIINIDDGYLKIPDLRLRLKVFELIFKLKGYFGKDLNHNEDQNYKSLIVEVETKQKQEEKDGDEQFIEHSGNGFNSKCAEKLALSADTFGAASDPAYQDGKICKV